MNSHYTTTRSPRAALLLGLLSFSITAATTAQAGNQLFEGSWSVKSFGNECSLADPTPGPYCGNGAPESEFYSAFGIPQGIQCNPNQPRCPFESTPTDGSGMFATLGGSREMALFCAPWFDWQGNGTTQRPAKSGTIWTSGGTGNWRRIPPLYRNPAFFSSGGEPNTTSCTPISTGATPGGKGRAQAGNPVAGTWSATTTGTQKGGFFFAAALRNHAAGVRTTGEVGDFPAIDPYVYSYTYAMLRNDRGDFRPGWGSGSFNFSYKAGTQTVARVVVKQGAKKFGGTMTMLGALYSKGCYYRNGGCSLTSRNGRYDAIGTSAHTSAGVVTAGYRASWRNWYATAGCPYPPSLTDFICRTAYAYRFPWTTGSVTVTARGRDQHKTVHYARGYDNRNTTTPSGKGTIQMVTPVLTRWLQSEVVKFQTAGIGILRIKFIPEPQAWTMLVAGVSLLGVGARMRGRRSSQQ